MKYYMKRHNDVKRELFELLRGCTVFAKRVCVIRERSHPPLVTLSEPSKIFKDLDFKTTFSGKSLCQFGVVKSSGDALTALTMP